MTQMGHGVGGPCHHTQLSFLYSLLGHRFPFVPLDLGDRNYNDGFFFSVDRGGLPRSL